MKAGSEVLAPVRDSYANDTPVRWVRVHMLPDHAYFDHSVHLAVGDDGAGADGDPAVLAGREQLNGGGDDGRARSHSAHHEAGRDHH